MAALAHVVGARLTLVTHLDERIEGELFAYDKDTGFVVMKCPIANEPRKANFRMIKQTHVKEICVIGSSPASAQPLPRLSTTKLEARCETVLNQKGRLIGTNVTAEAQDIFDALQRTLPCHWNGADIVVLDEVHISPPYTVAACKHHRGAEAAYARVKKVLEGERKRLGLSK